jgi:Mn2+/Fe2+ NRAMP family transporter
VQDRPVSKSETEPVSAEGIGLGRLMVTVGPGLVYGLSVLGAGDIVSNSAAGASYEYHLIWALWMALIFRYVWVNVSAKYVLVTGESLLAGYGRVGRWVPLLVMVFFFPARHLTNEYLILMMGSSGNLLFPLPTPWSSVIWACLFTVVGFAMTFWGGYPAIERFCKVLVGIMGGSLLIAALLSKPDPAAIVSGTLIPRLPQAQGLYSALLIAMALIGTEAGSTANLYYAYFIREKGWKGVSYMKQQRIDLLMGVVSLFVMGALLQIAAAGTIHPLGIQVQDPEDLAGIFSETQGSIGLIVFSLGLWGAAFSSFVGFNLGGALVFTDICRTFIPRLKDSPITRQEGYTVRKDPIYRGMIAFWAFSPLYIVFTGARAVWIVLMFNALQVLLIPALAVPLLKITNDKRLMGDYRNGWLTNLVLCTLVLIALYFTHQNAINLWNDLGQLR